MNDNLNTHGFFPSSVDIHHIADIKTEIEAYLLSASYPSYIPNIASLIPAATQLISKELWNKVISILESDNPVLESVELHYLPPYSLPIPPHQDNFYHCLEGGEGLKVLIPLTPLNASRGGLYFFDCPSKVGILPHLPSDVKNFSSFISEESLRKLDYSVSTYDYDLGDASYHLLNSIHFSQGNQSEHNSIFLVFRYQSEGISPSISMMKRYNATLMQHHKNLLTQQSI